MVKVKICGNRSIDEVRMAIEAGADAVGFLVGVRHYTEDSLEPEPTREIVRRTPPFVSTVVVTHVVTAKEVLELYEHILPTTIQLHDDIPPGEIERIRTVHPHLKLIKAIHVIDENAVLIAQAFSPYVDGLLLDSRTEDRIGGTGLPHDWDISKKIIAATTKPVILAGGLTSANIVAAIAKVRPYGVDVHTGVEDTDGNRDESKLKDFIRYAKGFGDSS